MKEEVEILKEEQVMNNEQLIRYEKHCDALQGEVIEYFVMSIQLNFYKDQNKDLMKRLDDCEKSMMTDNENTSVIIFNEG